MLLTNIFKAKKKLISNAKKPIKIKPNRAFSSRFFISCCLKIIFLNRNPLAINIKHIKKICKNKKKCSIKKNID